MKEWTKKFYDENYELFGMGEHYSIGIDKDEAVDEKGKAIYSYYILVDSETLEEYLISDEEMEDFRKTKGLR